MKRLYTVLTFVLVVAVAIAQDNKELEDLKLRSEANYFTNLDSTKYYADLLMTAARAKNNQLYLGEGLRLKGVYYQLKVMSDSAKHYFEAARDIFIENSDSTRWAKAKMSIALMDINTGDYDQALNSLLVAKSVLERQEEFDSALRCVAEIARLYSILGDHDKALVECQYYYSKVKNSDDIRQLATALNYLSVEFMHAKEYDSALYYINENLGVQKTLSYSVGIAAALQNRGSVYVELEKFDLALSDFMGSLKEYRKANFAQGEAQVNLNIASTLMRKGTFPEAITHLDYAQKIGQELGDIHLLREVNQRLSDAYSMIGDYEEALAYFESYHGLNDSLFNIERQKTISDLQTKYETSEKEKQIVLQDSQISEQEAQLARNNLLLVVLLVVLIAIAIITILARSRMQKKQELALQQKELNYREAQLNAVIDSQEKERKRFATDLHDGFGQLISVLKMNVDAIRNQNGDIEKKNELFKKSTEILNGMYDELRGICFNLMPHTLVQQGLVPALKEFADRINLAGKITVEVMVFDFEERVSDLQEISLYRVVQEWVNNILKYGNATNITIQLTKDDDELTLTIEDNGQGFDKSLLINGKGNGWKNINSRANLIKAEIDIDTSPQQRGTMFTMNVPSVSNEQIANIREKGRV